jgi:hypothetical protein
MDMKMRMVGCWIVLGVIPAIPAFAETYHDVVSLPPPMFALGDKWINFTSVEHGFSVKMPCEPEQATTILNPWEIPSVDTWDIDTIHSYNFTCRSSPLTCVVSHEDNPYPDSSQEYVLQMKLHQLTWNGPDPDVKKIRLQGHRGYEIKKTGCVHLHGTPTLELYKGVPYRSFELETITRVFVIHNRIYKLSTRRIVDQVEDKMIRKFFRSFTVKRKVRT